MTASRLPARFIQFVAAGGVAAGVNFCSRIVLSKWLSFPVAIVLAYLLGLITAFLLNRYFVFADSTKHVHKQMAWFVAVNALAIVQTLLVSLLFADYILPHLGITWHAEEIAHAFGIVTPVFTSYLGHKKFSFAVKS